MGQCCSSGDAGIQRRQRTRRNSLSLKQNQVYHLNHIECLPYQGRRSRYSTQSSSFLGLVTRQHSAGRSIPSTRQSSIAGSNTALRQDSILTGSTPGLCRDSMLASSNPVLLRRHRNSLGVDPVARQLSLSDLAQQSMSYNDYRRSGVNRVFRSYLDYQAVRQSYLLAVSQESLLESTQTESVPELNPQPNQSTHSLSMEVFLALPFHLVIFLFCPWQAEHTKCTLYCNLYSVCTLYSVCMCFSLFCGVFSLIDIVLCTLCI